MIKPRTLMFGAALASVIALVAPAAAQSNGTDGQAAVSTEKASAEADDQKMVCRKIRTTGTRVAKKTCRTRAQWVAIEEAARESANTIQGAGAVNTTPTVGG